ncbi:hypothetical protein GD1_58 [Paraglaciecola Antarctic GD virus 1]|nr:hypothetical protein GD1_58 [Paraglaciecola Antarctic GD virus 1]
MKVSKVLQKARQARIKKNFSQAILERDAEKVHNISKMLGLKFTEQQIQDLFTKKHE